MERTLEALEKLGEGEDILLQLYCQPHPLFNILRSNGVPLGKKDFLV